MTISLSSFFSFFFLNLSWLIKTPKVNILAYEGPRELPHPDMFVFYACVLLTIVDYTKKKKVQLIYLMTFFCWLKSFSYFIFNFVFLYKLLGRKLFLK